MKWNNLPERLEGCGIRPNVLHLQQYFLIDEDALYATVGIAEIEPRDVVIEVGAGVGNITEILAQQAGRVISYEIDKRFDTFLSPLMRTYSNLSIKIEDVKRVKWPKFDCLVANIPFNLLEPISLKLVQTKFRSAVLIVGNRFSQFVGESFSPNRITKFSVMMHAFFKIAVHRTIEKSKFYPEPSTDAIIVELTPAQPKTYFLQFCRSLFENQNKLVGHVLANGMSEGKHRSKKIQLDLPVSILNMRADRLSNSDFKNLFLCFP